MNSIDRRNFLASLAGGTAASVGLNRAAWSQQSQRTDHFARGTDVAVTSTSREATEAAMLALSEGGNAADAYMSAAITQTVSEIGLTSIAGPLAFVSLTQKRRRQQASSGDSGPQRRNLTISNVTHP